MKVAKKLELNQYEKRLIDFWHTLPTRLGKRAALVKLASEGWLNKDIAEEEYVEPHTVARWRNRVINEGVFSLLRGKPRGRQAYTIIKGKRSLDSILKIIK